MAWTRTLSEQGVLQAAALAGLLPASLSPSAASLTFSSSSMAFLQMDSRCAAQ